MFLRTNCGRSSQINHWDLICSTVYESFKGLESKDVSSALREHGKKLLNPLHRMSPIPLLDETTTFAPSLSHRMSPVPIGSHLSRNFDFLKQFCSENDIFPEENFCHFNSTITDPRQINTRHDRP